LGLGRGLLRLASNIGAAVGGTAEEAEAEAEASPETREQKMAHALKLVIELVKGPIGVDDRINLPAHVEKLLTDLVANDELAEADMLKVMCNMTPITSDLHLEAQMSKGQAAIETLLFTYADMATDVLMIAQYYADGRATVATLMAAVLAFSLVVQAFCGHALGQGKAMTLAGLFGMKPAAETVRDLLDAAPFPNQVLSNVLMLGITRMAELVFESSPETVIQTVALLATPAAEQSTLQYASLLSSIAAIGALTTLGDREVDTIPSKREGNPWLFGYVSRKPWKNMVQLAASAVAIGCYTAARMLALGTLIVAALERWKWSVAALAPPLGWVTAECGLLAVARVRDGSWHFYQRAADIAAVRAVMQLVLYVGMSTAPFPMFRIASLLGPHLYSRTLACLSASNFALVAVAYGVLGGVDALPATYAWAALGGLTLVAWAAAAVLVACAPAEMRKSFYEVVNWKTYVRTWWWEEATYDSNNLDGEEVELFGQEAVRAFLPVWVCRAALPVPELKTLYEERWAAWEAESPKWFNPAFEECVYDELAPPQVLAARVEARAAAAAAEKSGILSRAFSRGRGVSRSMSRALSTSTSRSTSRVLDESTSTSTSAATAARTGASTPPSASATAAAGTHRSGAGVEEGPRRMLQPELELGPGSGAVASPPLEAWSQ